jgi:hypothetical protein
VTAYGKNISWSTVKGGADVEPVSPGEFRLVIRSVTTEDGWITTRAGILGQDSNNEEGVVEWRQPDNAAVWTNVTDQKLPVSGMATPHVQNARDYLQRGIDTDRWIFPVSLNDSHNKIVKLALKSVRRLHRWRSWIARFDYELKERATRVPSVGIPLGNGIRWKE